MLTQDFVYDDFIPDFTASKFNASAWVDLFDKAGAKYFVLVSVSGLPLPALCLAENK
jgi:alpha-L-fucosidase